MKKFYVVTASDIVDKEFFDLKMDDRAKLIDNSLKTIKSPFLKILRKIHLSGKINKYFCELPFRNIWSKFKKFDLETSNEYYIIFPNGEIYPISSRYLNKIKKKYNVHFILLYGDHLASSATDLAKFYQSKIKFDYFFTINPYDAKEYNLTLINLPYSIISDKKNIEVKYDLYFIGNEKGRLKDLLNIYSYMNDHSVKMLYFISSVNIKNQTNEDIIYNKNISYISSVENTIQSNCILEILTPGQTGSSLRYYEAVCYNKKLLTNNKNVVNLPFYNPEYIHVFEKPEDIDCNWVKERIQVDYHYDGRFSPVHLIDKIIELEDEKNNSFDK